MRLFAPLSIASKSFILGIAGLLLLIAPGRVGAEDASLHTATLQSADGVEIVYTERGDGETALVFIHCWACNQRFWREQVEILAESYRVVTFDLPGHGESGTTRENWTIAGYALDVKTVVEALGLTRIVLVGHSMGGPIALASYPHLAKQTVGIVVIDSVHDAETPIPAEAVEAWAMTMEADFESTMQQMATTMFAESASPELRDWVIGEANASNHEAMIALVRDFAKIDVKNWLSATKVPVRAINAAPRPPMVPETKIETNRQYADFDAVLMEGVGHYLFLEKPEEFNALLTQKLEELLSDAPPPSGDELSESPD